MPKRPNFPLEKRKAKKPTKSQVVKRYKKKLDELQLKIFRLIHGDSPRCVCCGVTPGWFHPQNNSYGIQLGHFKTSARLMTRWDRENIYPQCAPCNYKHEQDEWPFTKYLLETKGQEFIDDLTTRSLQIAKFTLSDYEMMIANFEDELSSLGSS